jgi:uncharacterized protein YdeI (YjbR/CyaY-like superfamily)
MITTTGIAVPEDMAAALAEDPEALTAFGALWATDQLEYVHWLGKPGQQTRAQRLGEIAGHVRNHKHRMALKD